LFFVCLKKTPNRLNFCCIALIYFAKKTCSLLHSGSALFEKIMFSYYIFFAGDIVTCNMIFTEKTIMIKKISQEDGILLLKLARQNILDEFEGINKRFPE
jgi:hypothetical protein